MEYALQLPSGYPELLQELKQQIYSAQLLGGSCRRPDWQKVSVPTNE